MLQLIYNEEITKDVIFLQIPPVGRELYIDNSSQVTSIASGAAEAYPEPIRSYLFSKVMTHNILQYSVEDLMDLVLISNLCKQKNIQFYLIDFHREIEIRLQDLTDDRFKFIKDNLFTETKIISFAEISMSAVNENRKLLGRHYDQKSHQEMADKIINMLPEIFNSQA